MAQAGNMRKNFVGAEETDSHAGCARPPGSVLLQASEAQQVLELKQFRGREPSSPLDQVRVRQRDQPIAIDVAWSSASHSQDALARQSLATSNSHLDEIAAGDKLTPFSSRRLDDKHCPESMRIPSRQDDNRAPGVDLRPPDLAPLHRAKL